MADPRDPDEPAPLIEDPMTPPEPEIDPGGSPPEVPPIEPPDPGPGDAPMS